MFLPVTDTHWRIESHLFADLAGNICEFLASATRLRLCYYRTFCPTANLTARDCTSGSRYLSSHYTMCSPFTAFVLLSYDHCRQLNLPTCTTVLVGLHQKGWEGERISPPILNYIADYLLRKLRFRYLRRPTYKWALHHSILLYPSAFHATFLTISMFSAKPDTLPRSKGFALHLRVSHHLWRKLLAILISPTPLQ